jgi:hypothetical protein
MDKEFLKGGNPYMPLWEHVPDGEPKVFEYNGETRVFVYGSHDTLKKQYCGLDYVAWSAPADDLNNWTCHGVCFRSRDGEPLFAPDVVQKGDTFFMYVSEARGSKCSVAVSKSPAGPFTNPVETKIGFDPGVLVDDDGKQYAFWGFCGANCGELEDDMTTLKPDSIRENPIGHCDAPWAKKDGNIDFEAGFFEASSPRKILGKYVLIYSKNYNIPVPSLGVVPNNNGFLSYAYSDSPLTGYIYGGDISFNGGEIITLPGGEKRMTYQWGNNHGSLVRIRDKWFVFYHRQTGLDEYSRQAMLEPVDVALDRNGRLFIGKITYRDGEPVSSCPVEMTSQGAFTDGLDAYKIISAGRACHIYDGKDIAVSPKSDRPYVKPVYDTDDSISSPVVNISSGTTVGFRYLDFGDRCPSHVTVRLNALTDISLEVIIDAYDGETVGKAEIFKSSGYTDLTFPLSASFHGKHAVYFKFNAIKRENIAEFDSFSFEII